MSLKEQTIQQIEQNNININPNYDQHFLVDETLISELISSAKITKKEIVLEIGSGTGNITKELAKHAQKVICVEVDSQFKQVMQNQITQAMPPTNTIMPSANTIIIYDHAMDVLKKSTKNATDNTTNNTKNALNFNKIVANIPFSICEPLLKYLLFAKQVELCVLIVPKSFAEKAQVNPIFTAFLNIRKGKDIPKESFYPLPDTISSLISITHRPNYEEDKDDKAFLKRKLYMQEEKKLANGLREAIIDLYMMKYGNSQTSYENSCKLRNTQPTIPISNDLVGWVYQKRLSKKDAKKIIDSLELDVFLLETLIKDMPLEAYDKIVEKISI